MSSNGSPLENYINDEDDAITAILGGGSNMSNNSFRTKSSQMPAGEMVRSIIEKEVK
jgi:hypothetical protein